MLKEVSKQFSPKIKKYLLILIGSASWLITMVKSGLFYGSLGTHGPGIGFWGANGHDGVWHIALSEALNRGSFQMPIFAGSNLQNYHLGFDLLLVLVHKVTFLSIPSLYFQILPILFALLIGILCYEFTFKWTNSYRSAWWSTFFVYFGGSFGFLVGGSESTFWSQQSISTLINPPFALSLIFILLGLNIFIKLEQHYSYLNYLLCVLIFGTLIEIKAYAGILVIGAFFVSGMYSYIFYKNKLTIKIFVGVLMLSALLFVPLNWKSPGLLVFQPFWFLESMMGLVDRLNYTQFYSAMLSYRSGSNYPKAILFYVIAFGIFWIGNIGSRIIGNIVFIKWIKNITKLKSIDVFMFSIIITGVLIPTFFVQKGTPWNTIQFFYYSIFFTAILSGIVVGKFLDNTKINALFLYSIELLLILITIPTTTMTLRDVYIPVRPPAMVSKNELLALDYLSTQPSGVVLTKPFSDFDSKLAENNPPRPLYLYTSTAYVSAFSKHDTYLEDEINLDITDFNWEVRRDDVLSWYGENDPVVKRQFLIANNIKYIYWIKEGQSPLDLAKLGVKNIYENSDITIYMVE